MITDLIINVILAVPYLLLSGFQSFTNLITIPSDTFEILKDLCVGAYYVLPVDTLLGFFFIRVAFAVSKIAWSLIIRGKSFIPTMGA